MIIKNQAIRAHSLMLITAAIWGFAFDAQREAMLAETIGPFLFNAASFLMGVGVLSPLVWYLSKK